MQIELDIFSGRKNPTWVLTDKEAKDLLTKFKSLDASDSKKPLFDGLGYRGFKVTGLQDYDDVTVWNGIVQASGGGKVFRWNDKGRSLEKLLLRTSKGHIDGNIHKHLELEFEKE